MTDLEIELLKEQLEHEQAGDENYEYCSCDKDIKF